MDRLTVCILSCLLGGVRMTAGKVSDACHGLNTVNQTYNNLQCSKGSVICITEVKYYQWHPDSGCPYILSYHIDGCCKHNEGRCSWVRTATNDSDDLQRNCSGRNKCRLHSNRTSLLADPCHDVTISQWSSVRSIRYTCVTTGTVSHSRDGTPRLNKTSPTEHVETQSKGTRRGSTPKPAITSGSTLHTAESTERQHTTPPSGKKQIQNSEDTGVIVGGVIGGLVVCAVLIIAVVLYKRRKTSNHKSAEGSTVQEVAAVESGSSESSTVYSLAGQFDSLREKKSHDSLSATYSKPQRNPLREDTPGQQEVSYDHIQGEVTQFPAYRHEDYDHVTANDSGYSPIREVTPQHIDGGTYDRLQRGKAVPMMNTDDGYHTLNKVKTIAT